MHSIEFAMKQLYCENFFFDLLKFLSSTGQGLDAIHHISPASMKGSRRNSKKPDLS